VIELLARMVGLALIFVVIFAALSLLGAIPTYFLWNWLMPVLFGLKTITFWQAWGLLYLAALLFKSTSYSSKS